MKTLQEVKDEVAKRKGYKDFHTMQFPYDMVCEEDIDEITKIYAEDAIKEVAKIAKIVMLEVGAESITEVNKETILNLINELK